MKKIFLSLAGMISALFLASCGGDPAKPDTPNNNGGKTDPVIIRPLRIQLVSRFTDATLFSTAGDATAVSGYVKNDLSGRKGSDILVLDRTDGAGERYVQEINLANYKWSSFVLGGISSTAVLGSSILYNAPTRSFKSYDAGTGNMTACLASIDVASKIVTTIDGKVANSKDHTYNMDFATVHISTAAQAEALAASVLKLSADSPKFCIVGVVKNGLLAGMVSAVASGITVKEIYKGSAYSAFLLAPAANWAFDKCETRSLADGITACNITLNWN